jgi:hypothetical protein
VRSTTEYALAAPKYRSCSDDLVYRNARGTGTGRNPKTGGAIEISAAKTGRRRLVRNKGFVASISAEKLRSSCKDYLYCQVVELIHAGRMGSARHESRTSTVPWPLAPRQFYEEAFASWLGR